MRQHILVLSLTAILASCVTTTEDINPRPSTSTWLSASPVLERQIDDQAQRLPWTHGAERVELITWFAGVGEPAYEKLLGLCVDSRSDVAGAALAALGATQDQRLVPYLHALDWSSELDPKLRLERARAYVRLGDWSELGTLISGLDSEELFVRALSSQALFEATGERMDFDPRGTDEERRASVERWQRWLAARNGEGILASAASPSC